MTTLAAMLRTVLRPTQPTRGATQRPAISSEVTEYLADSYPPNHNYRVLRGRLVPKRKLYARAKKLFRLYPRSLDNFVDLSCSKGYFVVHAALQPQCHRALGIDVIDGELEASRAVQAHLGVTKARFEFMQLHELAERIDEFGGPFQTSLLVNTYQYLYFGSSICSDCYLSHDEIFRLIRRVCSGRLIFNNRTEFDRLQDHCRQVAREKGHEDRYNTDAIMEAATKYFDVKPHGKIGRYPLWALDAR